MRFETFTSKKSTMNLFKLAFIVLLLFACKEAKSTDDNNTMLIQFEETVSRNIQGKNWIVTFQSIEENSLCPEDVVCIWQGRLVVKLKINDQTRILAIGDLRTNEGEEALTNSVTVNGTSITLEEALDTEEASTTKIQLQFD